MESNMLNVNQPEQDSEILDTSMCSPLSPASEGKPNLEILAPKRDEETGFEIDVKQELIEADYSSENLELLTLKQEPEEFETGYDDVLLSNPTSKQELIDHDYTSENSPCSEESQSAIKVESPCSEESQSTIKVENTPLRNQKYALNSGIYTENRSLATSLKAKLFDFGNLNFKIIENKHVRKGLATGIHVVRQAGNMEISVTTKAPIQDDQFCVRATLVRKHVQYQHHAIDQICAKHIHCTIPELQDHMLQTNTSPEYCYYDDTNPRKSICFNLYPENKESNGSYIISLKFICSSTCSVTKNQIYMPERGREMYLVLTLENEYTNQVVARRSITVWPKAAMSLRDLNKLTRMEPKGAAAQILKIRSDQKIQILENRCIAIASQAKRFGINKQDFSKIVDKVWNIPTTQKYCPAM